MREIFVSYFWAPWGDHPNITFGFGHQVLLVDQDLGLVLVDEDLGVSCAEDITTMVETIEEHLKKLHREERGRQSDRVEALRKAEGQDG